jgi:hypothetical protein
MSRNELINRLVARKMAASASARPGCVPCLAGQARTHCWAPPKKLCLAPPNAKK